MRISWGFAFHTTDINCISVHLKMLIAAQILFKIALSPLLCSENGGQQFHHRLSAAKDIRSKFREENGQIRTCPKGKEMSLRSMLLTHDSDGVVEWVKEEEVGETALLGRFELTAHIKDVVSVRFAHGVGRHTPVSAVVGLVEVLDVEI